VFVPRRGAPSPTPTAATNIASRPVTPTTQDRRRRVTQAPQARERSIGSPLVSQLFFHLNRSAATCQTTALSQASSTAINKRPVREKSRALGGL
jgi:hypothetical protein